MAEKPGQFCKGGETGPFDQEGDKKKNGPMTGLMKRKVA